MSDTKRKKVIKTVSLDPTPEMLEFLEKQRNFSSSVRRLISLYCEEHRGNIDDVDYQYRRENSDLLKENERLKEELAAILRQQKEVVSSPHQKADSIVEQEQKQSKKELADDGIPEGYL